MILSKFFSIKHVVLFSLIVCLLSCTKSNDPTTNQFAGIWKGDYTGTGDNGSWTMNIAADGKVTGSATSVVFSQTYTVNGTVGSNGQIVITFGTASSGATFTGTLSGNSASGDWINNSRNPPYTGTWSGSKQ
jgi:hypothetical protein